MKVFSYDDEQQEKLKRIADELQGGSDKMRDIGHRLWLILKDAVETEEELA